MSRLEYSYTEVEIPVVVTSGAGSANSPSIHSVVRWAAWKGPASSIADFTVTHPTKNYVMVGGTAETMNLYSRPIDLNVRGVYPVAVANATVDGTYTLLLHI